MDIKNIIKFIKKSRHKEEKVMLSELRKYAKIDKKGDQTAYNVIRAEKEGMSYSITSLNPGFFTRGHRHKIPCPEIYILTEGKAKLITIEKARKKTINMEKSRIYFVPEKAWHRVTNIGKEKAVFITIYSSKAGHVYKK